MSANFPLELEILFEDPEPQTCAVVSAEIMLNSTTEATDPTGSSLIMVLLVLIIAGVILLVLFKKLQSRGNMQKVNIMHVTLPEGMDSSSAQPSTSAAVLSHEHPQTPGQEPTPATDALETEPMFDYAQPSTSADVLSQERPQTPGQEPTPATDAFETEPMFDYAQPSTSTAVFPERKPSSSPTDAPAQNNPTGRKGRFRLGRAGKAVKRGIKTFISKLCPCVPDREPSLERPQTPGQEPTPAESTDLTLMFPNEPRLQHKYFRSLYKVGKKLGYELGNWECDRVHKGIRRSDGREVDIRFVNRCRLLEALPEFVEEGVTLMKLQKPPTCEHIIQLYDRFIMEDQYILIMEHLPACVTLSEFIRRNRGGLTEETVKHIIWQIFVAMSHCMNRGAFMIMCRVNEQSILINPKTLQIKLADFDEVYFPRSENNPHELSSEFYFLCILNCLLNEIRHQPEKRLYLSRECQELRRQLDQRLEELYNLKNM